MRIRVIETPPGFAPEYIREAWVGVEMDVDSESDDVSAWLQKENEGGYVVTGEIAIEALRAANKMEAHAFWSSQTPPSKLRFRADCCEVIA